MVEVTGISGIAIMIMVVSGSFLVGIWVCLKCTKEGAPSASHNTGMLADAQICQNIVEDQLDYLVHIGLDFKEGEKDTVRDNLYRIVAGKIQHT